MKRVTVVLELEVSEAMTPGRVYFDLDHVVSPLLEEKSWKIVTGSCRLSDESSESVDAGRWRDLIGEARSFYRRYPNGHYVLPKERVEESK